jgi:DNA-binding NtrC family response regulator
MSIPNISRLLAIDDDPQTLALIADALGDERLEILTAENPEAGFEMFLRVHPRVVLLDLLMPGVSGMDMLKRMVSADPGANVIVISGHYSAESAVEAIQEGACD